MERSIEEGIKIVLTQLTLHGGEWASYQAHQDMVGFYRTDTLSGLLLIKNWHLWNSNELVLQKLVEEWRFSAMDENSYAAYWQKEFLRLKFNAQDKPVESEDKRVESEDRHTEGALASRPELDIRALALDMAVKVSNATNATTTAQEFYEFLTGQSQSPSTDDFDAGFRQGWARAIREAVLNLYQGGLPKLQEFVEKQNALHSQSVED